MDTRETPRDVTRDATRDANWRRRDVIGAGAFTAVTASFGIIGSASAQTTSTRPPGAKPGAHTSFGPLKQINAGLLNIGYAETGPAAGPAVLLLHGWPYDIYSFVDVAPLLASAGFRVIVPFVRGYGTT